MKITIEAYLGTEGFSERFAARRQLEDGSWEPCELRWAPAGGAEGADRLARVKDAGMLLKRFPHPLLPQVYAVAQLWNGIAVFGEAPGGRPLRAVPRESKPVPTPAILEVLAQVGELLHHLHHLVDPATGEELRLLHRSISADRIHLRPDGSLKVTGFDEMSVDWSYREAETSMMSLHPGSRLAPEQMAGQSVHRTDIYLLGLVAVDLLVDLPRASRFARSLALCIGDPEGFVATRDEFLDDPALELDPGLRELLRGVLQEEPSSRPDGAELARRARELGASAEALAAFAASLPPYDERAHAEPHDFVGRSVRIRTDSSREKPPAPPSPPDERKRGWSAGRTILPTEPGEPPPIDLAPPGLPAESPPQPVGLGEPPPPGDAPAERPRPASEPRPLKVEERRHAAPAPTPDEPAAGASRDEAPGQEPPAPPARKGSRRYLPVLAVGCGAFLLVVLLGLGLVYLASRVAVENLW